MARLTNRIRLPILIFVIWFGWGGGVTMLSFSNDIVIIVHKEVSTDVLTFKEVKNIFLGKKKVWPSDNTPIVPVILRKGTVHETFLAQFLGRKPGQFANHWRNMVFTGKGMLPRSFSSEDRLVDYVASTKGAIGYIAGSSKTDNVKVIRIKGADK